jgi:hypothetical protein
LLTIFTVPKPFCGHFGDIQRKAIESWRALGRDVQVVLVGDEEGVEEAARDGGVAHVGGLARNDRGTPRLDSAFERTAQVARSPLWCFVNADIVLLDDFPRAIARVASVFGNFLIVGESRDLAIPGDTRLGDAAVRAQLRKRAMDDGRLRGYAALDYFVFPKGLFDPVPPFLIGRACFDNWMVWRARELRRPVVDATRSIVAIHQSHDYSHVRGGKDEAYYGEEARYNEQLAGGRDHIYSLHEASHRLYRYGAPVPYLGSIFRAREKARLARIRWDIRMAARRERKAGRRRDQPVRLLGVFPEPSIETTLLLDAVSDDDDVDLHVVYAEEAPPADAASTQSRRHRHWFARNLRVARLDHLLGRRYPITPTIWHSLYFVKPDCMLISGWSTFPTQAAIAWCTVRRVPYLLLVDEEGHGNSANGDRGVRRALVDTVARRSAGVLISRPRTRTSLLQRVGSERVRDLPKATDATPVHLLDLARSACDDRWIRRRARNGRAVWRHRRS